jgi:hypothetical protein
MILMTDCAALVTRSPIAAHGLDGALGKYRQCALGSFTKTGSAREDVLQSSKMFRHGSRGPKLKCRIPPASNVKKKQEFA